MLSFFRINDPYRLLILLIAILLVRLPYLITGELLTYELDWMITGEAISASNVVLYKDFLSPIAPLSGWLYALLNMLFGKHQIVFQLLSIALIAYQFSLFNNIMYKNKAYNENTYIPALIYALLMQAFFDFFTLSPVLISLTFILLVLDNIYLRIENKLEDSTILKTGVFMGLAVLFWLPSIIFFIATLISFALLTSLIFRRYLLFIYGFVLPFLGIAVFYFWFDSFTEMVDNWILFTFDYSNKQQLTLWSLVAIIIIPALFYVISLYKTFTTTRFTNYQVRVQQVMFIMFLAAWGSWLLSNEKAPYQLVVFVPFMAFFIGHYVQLFKSKLKAEIIAILFTILVIGVNYYTFFNEKIFGNIGNYYELFVSESYYDTDLQDKDVLVLGDSRSIYMNNNVVTPFYNWSLTRLYWEEFEKPEHIVYIYSNLKKSPPQIIIDENQVVENIFEKMPTIAKSYKKVSSRRYELIHQN